MSLPMTLSRSRTKRFSLALALALLVGAGGSVAVAQPAHALEVKHKYYDNWFKSKETCKARGNSLMQSQGDWISFICYRDAGDPKWSMDAYVDDGTGCRVAATRESEFVARCG